MIKKGEANFDYFLTNELNEQQRIAATKENGALLVVAGAGSGKTRVITSRITNLIMKCKVSAHAIVALTFTNRAASEMKSRIMNFIDKKHGLPFVGTFHSYCLMLLRKHTDLLPTQHFTILDGDDQLNLIKQIIKRHSISKHMTPTQIKSQISMLKNEMFVFGDTKKDSNLIHPVIKEIYFLYEGEKKNSSAGL